MNDSGFLELCVDGTPEEIERAIQAGANVMASNNSNENALHFAAMNNEDPGAVSVLIENGADVNSADDNGWTALHYATLSNDNPEVVKVLLENRANINARDSGGDTPLINAVTRIRPKHILLLLEYGADANIKNKTGETAADMLPDWILDGIDKAEWNAAVASLNRR